MHRSVRLSGHIADLPTPFDATGAIDWAAFDRLCERQIDAGADAIVVGETAGEASTLTPAEHQDIVRAAVGISRGRISVIAGAGSNSTSQAVALARQAEASGADAILSVVPYYNKPMQDGIEAHFRAVAESTGLPIILHDCPSRTARDLADTTIARLAQSRQFVGLRDSTGDVTRPLRLQALVPPEFCLLSGDDATAAAYMLQGGHGCISMMSNVVPDLCRQVDEACLRGELRTVNELSTKLAPLAASLSQEATSSALKYALSLLGLMSPSVRLPMVELTKPSKAMVARAIATICDLGERLPRGNRRYPVGEWHTYCL
jgi:4-hydroxy-tetrahydrodipicolinate synthase